MSTLSWSIDLSPSAILQGAHLRYYVALATIAFVAWCFSGPKKEPVDVPLFKAGKTKWMFEADRLIRESYNKYKDRCYQIKATEGLQVLLPPKFVSEIKSLPEDVLSATVAVREALLSKYTNFCPGPHGDLLGLLIRTKLGQNLARLGPALREELDYIVSAEFPPCDDWTPVKVQPFALRTVSRLSGRVFVGKDICRQEKWMDVSINYAVHVFVAVVKLQFFPDWMRPVAQYLVSELRKIREDITTAKGLVEPLIRERLDRMEEEEKRRDEEDEDKDGHESDEGRRRRLRRGGKDHDDEDGKKPDDFAQWLLEGLPASQRGEVQTQIELQLILSAASIHTTNNLLTDCVLDLAAHPDMQDELRAEIMEMMEEEGGWEKKDALNKLKKMDSFIKETQRLSGNVTSFIRKVMKPITLSDGTYLPPGTNLLAPLAGVSHDPRFLGITEEDTKRHQQEANAGSTTTTTESRGTSDKKDDTSKTTTTANNTVPEVTLSPTNSTSAESISSSDSASISGSTFSEAASSVFDQAPPSVASATTDVSLLELPSQNGKLGVDGQIDLDNERTPISTTFKTQDLTPKATGLPASVPEEPETTQEGPSPADSPLSPSVFDALRYHKLRRRSPEDANRYQFTSLSDSNMNFGGGRHACPGRFFAGCEIKTILGFFLSRYEIRLKPDGERPKSMSIMMSRSPSPDGEVEFRRI